MVTHNMMDRRSIIRGAGTLGVTGLAGCISGDSSGENTFTVSGHLPETSFIVQESLIPFTEMVEERSDGEISFELYHDGALADPGSQIELINNGASDIAFIGPGFMSDQVPLSGVFDLPGSFSSSTEGSPVMLEMLNGTLYEEELQELNLKPLAGSLASPYQVAAAGDPITEQSDWNGVDVRSGGGIMSITINTLGGNPVEMTGGETYQGLERGTVNAVAFPIPSITDWDIGGLLNNCSTNAHLGSFAVTWMMNDETWSGLSDEHKEIMSEAGEEATMNIAEVHDSDAEDVATQLEEEEGVDMYEIPDDEWSSWEQDLQEQVGSEWVNQIDNSSAQDILDEWMGSF